MRLFFKFFVAVVAIFIVASAGFYYWLAYYNGDLLDVSSLAQFSPANQATAIDSCSNTSITVLPPIAFGKHLPNAISATEDFDPSAPALNTLSQSAGDVKARHNLPLQLARILICHPGKSLDYQFKTIRLGIRLERKFTNQQLFTIYMNHVYLGQNLQGVYAASQSYFEKPPDQLSLAESATLAGLIRQPNYYLTGPDKLLLRRNEVLDKMASSGKITQEELQIAEQEPTENLNGPATKKR
jgi:membrane carboxypeptidase/penicillin-binding protein